MPGAYQGARKSQHSRSWQRALADARLQAPRTVCGDFNIDRTPAERMSGARRSVTLCYNTPVADSQGTAYDLSEQFFGEPAYAQCTAYPDYRRRQADQNQPCAVPRTEWVPRFGRGGWRGHVRGDGERPVRSYRARHHDAGRGRAVAVPPPARREQDPGRPAHRPVGGNRPYRGAGAWSRRLYLQALQPPGAFGAHTGGAAAHPGRPIRESTKNRFHTSSKDGGSMLCGARCATRKGRSSS